MRVSTTKSLRLQFRIEPTVQPALDRIRELRNPEWSADEAARQVFHLGAALLMSGHSDQPVDSPDLGAALERIESMLQTLAAQAEHTTVAQELELNLKRASIDVQHATYVVCKTLLLNLERGSPKRLAQAKALLKELETSPSDSTPESDSDSAA